MYVFSFDISLVFYVDIAEKIDSKLKKNTGHIHAHEMTEPVKTAPKIKMIEYLMCDLQIKHVADMLPV